MIHFITGKPGGGKSYYAVRQIVHELCHGSRFVVTNLPLRLDAVADYCHENSRDGVDLAERLRILTEEETRQFWLYEGPNRNHKGVTTVRVGNKIDSHPDFSDRTGRGTFYVIDEVHVAFSARNWQATSPDCLYYQSQHRKLGDDVLLISQHPEQVDKGLRRLAQDFTVIRNLNNESILGFRVGRLFRRATYLDHKTKGDNQPAQETGYFRLEVGKFGSLYDTTAGVGIMARTDIKESRGRGRSLFWLPVIIACILAALWYAPQAVGALTKSMGKGMLTSMKDGAKGMAGKAIPGTTNAVLRSVTNVVAEASVATNAPERVYVVGRFVLGTKGRFVLSNGEEVRTESGRIRYIDPDWILVDGKRIDNAPINTGRGGGEMAMGGKPSVAVVEVGYKDGKKRGNGL